MGKQYDGVRAASESTIEIDFYYAGTRCRERVRLEPTPANLKRAANHRAGVLDAIARGTFDYATTFPDSKKAAKFTRKAALGTVGQYLESWVDSKAPTIKTSTAEGYRKAISGRLVPSLGAIGLAALKRQEVRAMCEAMAVSNKRIANVLSVLRTALDDAVGDQLIDENPIAHWTYARNEAPKEEDDVDPFTAAEQDMILKAADGQGRNFIQFALWTGLRTSELVGLRWDDIDWQRGEIRVRRATTQAAKGTAEKPKTVSSKRAVKLLAKARQALEAQKSHTLLLNGQIFMNPRTGEPWTGDQPIRKTMWEPALKRAKVRYRIPYQTRHTYASMMLSAGEHPMWVANQMGHADWGMIRTRYGRWMPDAQPDAGSKAEALYGPADGQLLANISPKNRMNTG
jgi:integrase